MEDSRIVMREEKGLSTLKTLQHEYTKRLASEIEKVDLEREIFQAQAERSHGLAKAKYFEQIKIIQARKDRLSQAIKEIEENRPKLAQPEFRNSIESLLQESTSLRGIPVFQER